ncbi:MAG: nucleoside triphosphate pyrophosphohydrolase [Xanthomonadaceae bacterium]|jgi:ATP diphosphatase|nr:nucleoside triphosphate pyrophosphohydrolase [Xanthomonadaceae bacterium]
MSDIQRLLAIMARLRDPQDGCPWDVQQDFSSIAPYTIEEAYEVADAIERRDMPELRDELGDLLLQVVFHAQMAQEEGHFAFGDVVGAICDKMIRRHPHVFGPDRGPAESGLRLDDARAQGERWEAIKRAEKGGSAAASALDGIAAGLPEWVRASKLQACAAKVGFDWPSVDPVLDKLHEEIDEVRAELQREPRDAGRLSEEIGDVLFVCVNLARHAGVDYGHALRQANLKFERRFRAMEAMAAADGLRLADLPLAAQDAYWERAKRDEKAASRDAP